MITSFPNIELTPFSINNSKEVNPWPMDDMQVQVVNGELMIYMRGHVGPNGELPGALVGFTLPVVNTVLGKQMTYAGLNYEVKIDEASSALLECWESDLKWCINAAAANPIPNVVDGSSQKVYSKGGIWQIDDANGNWVNSGYKPGPFPVNQWNKVGIRQSVQDGKFSFLSITDAGTTFTIPSSLRPLPLLNTNWTATGVQLQMCLAKTGFAVAWVRNISAVFSDTPA